MMGAGAAASSAADRAAAAQAAAGAIVADVERRLQASGQPGPEGGVKALALPQQAGCFWVHNPLHTYLSYLRQSYGIHCAHQA